MVRNENQIAKSYDNCTQLLTHDVSYHNTVTQLGDSGLRSQFGL